MLRIPRASARSLAALLAPVLLAPGAAAQVQAQPGDFLVCRFSVGGPSTLQHFRADGTHVRDSVGASLTFEGVALTHSGKYFTGARSGSSVHLFDDQGLPAGSFSTPEVSSIPGDVAVFADGTLAVADQSGDVETYDESGVHQGRFTAATLGHPFGIHVDASDNLWACDIDAVDEIFGWDRQGVLLHSFSVPFEPGDLVRDADGTLWVADRPGHNVVQFDVSGTQLSSFHAAAVTGNFECIGLHPDGTLYLAGEGDSSVHRYTKQGQLLESLPLGASGAPVFLTVVQNGGLGTPYCFGDEALMPCPCANPGATGEGCAHSGGVGARLLAFQSSSLGADDLTLQAQQLVPSQPVLLFAGANAVNGGLGAHFGDGLRCAGGAVVRLGVAVANAGGDAQWGQGLLTGTSWVAGDTRRLQAWYRDPVNSPCGSAFNLSNGIELVLTP